MTCQNLIQKHFTLNLVLSSTFRSLTLLTFYFHYMVNVLKVLFYWQHTSCVVLIFWSTSLFDVASTGVGFWLAGSLSPFTGAVVKVSWGVTTILLPPQAPITIVFVSRWSHGWIRILPMLLWYIARCGYPSVCLSVYSIMWRHMTLVCICCVQGGKGRTGCVISAFMHYTSVCDRWAILFDASGVGKGWSLVTTTKSLYSQLVSWSIPHCFLCSMNYCHMYIPALLCRCTSHVPCLYNCTILYISAVSCVSVWTCMATQWVE